MSIADEFGAWKEDKKIQDDMLAGIDPSIQYAVDSVFKDTATAQDPDNVQEHRSIIDTAKEWLSAAPQYIADQLTGKNVVSDIANKTEQWAEGAIAGGQEVLQENPYAFSQGEGLNEEQLALGQTDIANQAGADFYQQTIEPAAFTAGLVKGVVAAPVMAGDLYKMMAQAPTVGAGLSQVAGEFSGYNSVKKNMSSGDFLQRLNLEPVTTASELLPAFLIGRGVYNYAKGRIHPSSPEVQETVQAIVDADKTKQVNDAIVETASKSKILDENPEIYEKIIADEIKGTPLETVYSPKESFDKIITDNNYDPAKVIDALGAKVEDGNVVIPYAKFLSVFGKDKVAKALSDDVKFSQDGLTQNEAVETAKAVKEHYEPQAKEEVNLTETEQLMKDFTDYYKLTPDAIETALKADRDRLIEEQYQYLRENSGGQGVQQGGLIRDAEGEVIGRYGRTSNNPVWYQEEFAKNGRNPSNKRLREIAEEQLLAGFNHEVGIIEPHPEFIALEEALNGIRQYREKVENGQSKRSVAEGNRDIPEEAKGQARDYARAINEEVNPKKDFFEGVIVDEPSPTEQGALPHPATVPNSTPVSRTIEPVTRREINDAVAKIVTTRIGRVGNKFLGIFKVDPEVARLRNYGDFDTLAHEVGHYLDKKLGIADTRFDAELVAGADKVWKGNKDYDQYTPAEKRAEGVAEFTRQYLINPAEARANFPDYVKSFENVLRGNKDMESAVQDVAGKMQNWFAQTPEARGKGSVSWDNKSSKTYVEQLADKWYQVYGHLYDDKVGLSRMVRAIEKALGRKLTYEENAYAQSRMAATSGVAKASMMVDGKDVSLVQKTMNKFYHGVIDHAVTIRSIVDGLKSKALEKKYKNYLENGNFKDLHEAFSTLLVAKRQVELQTINPEYKGSMLFADAEAIIKNAPKELHDLTEQFYKYNDNLMKIGVDAGIIKQEIYDALTAKYKNYAPMMRDFADEEGMTNAFSTGSQAIANARNPLQRLTEEGSTRSVIDPLESAIKNTYAMVSMAERNKASQSFVKLAQQPGIGKYIEAVTGAGDAGKNIFTVMINGEKKAFQTTPEIYSAIMSMNEASSSTLLKILAYPTGWLRAGATLTPDFVVRNLTRDTFTAAIYSKNGFIPLFDTAKGFANLIGNKELYYEYKASGAQMSTFVGLDRDNLQLSIGKLIKDSVIDKANPMEYLRAFSEMAETATRLGEFKRARDKGKSIGEAGLDAKDVTLDFSRGGTTVRKMNKASAFFNAVMQGQDRLVRAFWEDPIGFNIKASLYITMPSVMLWTMNHDQEWYKELPEWQKNTCWVFKKGNVIWRIPKPFEPGIIYGSLPERILDYYYNKDPKAVSEWAKSARDGFLPNFLPTAASPIVEWISNYSFFKDKAIVPEREKNLKASEQFGPYTSEVAKGLGKALNASPRKIDNAMYGYTGSLGRVAMTGADYTIGKFEKLPQSEVTEIPVIKSLTSRPYQASQSLDLFYEKWNEMQGEHQLHGKKGNPSAALTKMNKYGKEIGDLNRDERDMLSSTKYSSEEKRQRLTDINLKRLHIAQKALGN